MAKDTTSSASKRQHLLTFFTLYIAQSIPMSFFATVIPVVMRQEEFSLSTIGYLQLIKLPWIIKFLWAPLVDRHSKNIRDYKRWIISSEFVYAAFIILIACLNLHTNFQLVVVLIILSLVTSATQDIATDALAIRTTPHKGKALLNSMQSMGSFAGTLVGSGVLLVIYKQFGWDILLLCLALFVMIAVVPLWRNKKIQLLDEDQPSPRARFHDFALFFGQKGIWRQIIFLILYYSGLIGLLAMLRPYLVDLGYSMQDIGVMSGIVGTGFAFLSSFLAGRFLRKIGRSIARILFACFILLSTLYFLTFIGKVPSTTDIYIGIFLLWGGYGFGTIEVYTTAMDLVRPGREGTDFTIQIVLTHLSGIVVAILSGHVAQRWGYDALFVMASGLAALSLCYVLFFFPLRLETVAEELEKT